MENQIKDKAKDVYFLDKDHELKIVLTSIPHGQIFVKNDKGVLKISEEIFDKIKKENTLNSVFLQIFFDYFIFINNNKIMLIY